MAVALYLLSTLDETTPTWLMNVYFFLLGFSLGLVIQVLVIAVQNAVSYADLGAATSGATFFRTIGGCVRRVGVRRDLLQPARAGS